METAIAIGVVIFFLVLNGVQLMFFLKVSEKVNFLEHEINYLKNKEPELDQEIKIDYENLKEGL